VGNNQNYEKRQWWKYIIIWTQQWCAGHVVVELVFLT
jgi:hypothetical protein